MKIDDIILKIKHRWMRMRLQPIRVYCMHHVSAEFDAESMNACDWIQIDEFKHKVTNLQTEGVEFISLKEAYRHICEDRIRCKDCAVLTFDDGYASLKEILPWLEEKKIPATLFINGKYTDGKSYRKNSNEKYLTKDELFSLTSPLVEIGSHGWEHTDAAQMTIEEFGRYMDENLKLLQQHPCYISFHAYTWGRHTPETDAYMQGKHILPVYIDGGKNYNDFTCVHRELIDC